MDSFKKSPTLNFILGKGRWGARFSEFFTMNPNLKYNIFWGRGDGGGGGVVWLG